MVSADGANRSVRNRAGANGSRGAGFGSAPRRRKIRFHVRDAAEPPRRCRKPRALDGSRDSCPGHDSEIAKLLPQDRSGSHYFSARETDANYIRLNSPSPASAAPEHEKFLFYRGVGDFATPLRVTQGPAGASPSPTPVKSLSRHPFVLGLQERRGEVASIQSWRPANRERSIQFGKPSLWRWKN